MTVTLGSSETSCKRLNRSHITPEGQAPALHFSATPRVLAFLAWPFTDHEGTLGKQCHCLDSWHMKTITWS